ncbi:MAG: AAA family ATPase [Planctomycetes bacterium]|nr:AAA family ATPase [Planctomycetota bacterium]
MIESISIQGLRGILEGELNHLPPLGVLIGPNGCGKSTVLEAMALATAPDVGDLVGRCVRRRMEVHSGAKFLFRVSPEDSPSPSRITATVSEFGTLETRLQLRREPLPGSEEGAGFGIHIEVARSELGRERVCAVGFTPKNEYKINGSRAPRGAKSQPFVRFLDQRIGTPRQSLVEVLGYNRARGGKGQAEQHVRELLPDLTVIEILTSEGSLEPFVNLTFPNRSIPVALSGDGMESLVRLALELSGATKGIYLIEEPEAHQHIAAMARSAKIIASAVKSGSQVILSTHSLEFLDLLIDALGEAHVNKLGVLRLALRDGKLFSVHHQGEDVRVARATVEMDLR